MATLTNYNPNGSCCDEDRHKAPTHSLIHPLSLQDRGRHIPGFGRQHSSGGGGISSPFPIRSSTFIRSITARRTNRCAQCICHPVLQTGHASSMLLAKPFLLPVMKNCTAPSPSALSSIQVAHELCDVL